MARPEKYTLKDGTVIPSVTTITGRFKESGGLINWAYKQGKAGKGLYEARDTAAEAGSIVHAMVEAYLKGGEVETALAKASTRQVAGQAQQGFQNFLNWKAMVGMSVVSLEEPMVDEVWRYGGTPDAATVEVGGTVALMDWKTGGLYMDHLLQLAAYAHLWDVHHPEQRITGGFHLVRFNRESADFAHHFFGELEGAWKMFTHLRAAFEFDQQLQKRVK